MKRPLVFVLLALASRGLLPAASPSAEDLAFFERNVRPVLVARCVECHGEKKQKGKLRLDTLANALKASEGGKSIVPGKSADSALVKAIARVVEDDAMPPEGKGKPLTAEQVGLIRAWIDQGAK